MPFHIVQLGLFFFFTLIQYLFAFLLSNPEPTTVPRLPGELQEREQAGQTLEKELWEVEAAPSRREEDELEHHQAKSPVAFERAKPLAQTSCCFREGFLGSSDDAPAHGPTSSPGPSLPCSGSSGSRALGCCVRAP